MRRMTEDYSLIDEVRKHPILWDCRLKDYRNKVKQDIAWKKIAEALNVRVYDVEYRWHRLRKTFVRKKKKKMQSGIDVGEEDGNSLFMNKMSFLKPIIRHRNTLSRTWKKGPACDSEAENGIIVPCDLQSILLNGDDLPSCSVSSENMEQCNTTSGSVVLKTHNMEESETSPCSDTGSSAPSGTQGKQKQDVEAHLISIIEETNSLLRSSTKNMPCSSEEDEVRYFLLSLAPQLLSLSKEKRLICKTEFLKMLHNFSDSSF